MLIDSFSNFAQSSAQLLIVCEETSVVVAQGGDDCPSQSGQLDEHTDFVVLLGPVHGVSKHQSSLCVSVTDLHCKTLSAGDDIRWSVCVLVDGIFNQTDADGQIHSQLLPHNCLKGREDGHCSAFIQEHVKHRAR